MQDPTVDPIHRFFAAAARLWRTHPFESTVAGRVMSMDAPELDMLAAPLCLVTDADGTPALWWAETIDDSMALLTAFQAGEPDVADVEEPVRLVTFEKGTEMHPDARREITREGLEVADKDAYPMLVVLDGTGVRAPDVDDILLTTLCIEALADTVEANPGKARAMSHTTTVHLAGHAIEVTIAYPHADIEQPSTQVSSSGKPALVKPAAQAPAGRKPAGRKPTGRKPVKAH